MTPIGLAAGMLTHDCYHAGNQKYTVSLLPVRFLYKTPTEMISTRGWEGFRHAIARLPLQTNGQLRGIWSGLACRPLQASTAKWALAAAQPQAATLLPLYRRGFALIFVLPLLTALYIVLHIIRAIFTRGGDEGNTLPGYYESCIRSAIKDYGTVAPVIVLAAVRFGWVL